MPTRLHNLIRETLENSPHLTQRGLAERMGVNPAAVNRMLHGQRKIMAEEIPIIEAYLGLRLDLQYLQEAPRPGTRRGFSDNAATPFEAPVPVYGYAAGSDDVAKKGTSGLNLSNGDIVDWVARHPALNGIKDAFGIYVFSDSMEPRYFRGELIYVHPGRPPEVNKDCVIEMKNGDAFIKRLVKLGESKIRVRQFNPPLETDVSLKEVQALYSVIGRG